MLEAVGYTALGVMLGALIVLVLLRKNVEADIIRDRIKLQEKKREIAMQAVRDHIASLSDEDLKQWFDSRSQ